MSGPETRLSLYRQIELETFSSLWSRVKLDIAQNFQITMFNPLAKKGQNYEKELSKSIACGNDDNKRD
ncbi:MAG: hypothetical protein CO189_07580 [candidate division Zixibacteria bacterium CG_4_9_14_3_um_filter_46_8]|nr:MAG: hypothetical protein CO189_07580 [candidate division Zixibacteria bacterium CG_4_9_14_3_um_filter_46_8]